MSNMRGNHDMEDDERGKLFVGGLSWETTQENLHSYFSRFGEVIDSVVMKNNESGRSRGFGFVTFNDPSNVDDVIKSGPHQLDGRTIDPKPCNPRTLQKPKRTGGYPKVFLGGLPSNVTETDIRSFFSTYGNVMEVVIMYDQEKKKSRGFGFLSFENDAAVDRCVSEHYINLNGKRIEIKRAEPRDSANKMNDVRQGHWNPHQQGPPMGMANSMAPMIQGSMGPQGNMMQQYQGWGSSSQAGGYPGYPSSQYETPSWTAPPGPPQQQSLPPPPAQHWGSTAYNVQPTPASQAYGGYRDLYSRQAAGSVAPNSASSVAKSTEYPGFSTYSSYADTSYPQNPYQGGDSSQGRYPPRNSKSGHIRGFEVKD